MSYTQNYLSHPSKMLFSGTSAALRSGSILDKHASLPRWGRQGSFLPPKCSVLTPTLFLEMSLLEDHLCLFALRLVFMQGNPVHQSHPQSFSLSLTSYTTCQFYVSVEDSSSVMLLFFSGCWLCINLLLTMISFLKAGVVSSTSCVLCKHLAKCSKQNTWPEIKSQGHSLLWCGGKPFTISNFSLGTFWEINYLKHAYSCNWNI